MGRRPTSTGLNNKMSNEADNTISRVTGTFYGKGKETGVERKGEIRRGCCGMAAK